MSITASVMDAVSILAATGGIPAPIAGTSNVLAAPAVRMDFPIVNRCPICQQKISANKRFCLKHAVDEAKKAGLIAA